MCTREKLNRMEHYAFRTSQDCVKYEEIKLMVGGWHDSHPLILAKIAKKIFTKFVDECKYEEDNDPKVTKFHSVNYDDGTKMYRIFVYTKERTENRRKAMHISAGIYLNLANDLGYTRIFRMPCKPVFLYKF